MKKIMNQISRHSTIGFFLMFGVFLTCMPSQILAVGPGFTGISAKADTAETVFLNPAGMTLLEQPSWYINPMLVYTENRTEYSVEGVNGRREIEDDALLILPGLYYSRPLNERWSFGIGPNAASGFGASYGEQWFGRYLLDEWSLYYVGIAPSVAYRVNDALSLGFTLSVNYSQFALEKAVLNLPPGSRDGRFELEADGWAVGFNLSLLYEFSPQTRFGMVYRSELDASNDGTPEFFNLTPETQDRFEQAGILNQEISVDTNQPQSLMAGIYHDFGNGWDMTLDAVWVGFSNWNIDNVTIGDTEMTKESAVYQDIWAVSFGGTYDWKPD